MYVHVLYAWTLLIDSPMDNDQDQSIAEETEGKHEVVQEG